MSCQPAYTNAQGCVVTPACPGSTYAPGYSINQPILQWNSGANSVTEITGNASLSFSQPVGQTGVTIGYKTSRLLATVPNLITHGFYFTSLAGVSYAQIVERGQTIGAAFVYAGTDTFMINRANGVVTYVWNGTLLYTSTQLSFDTILTNACMYASGDEAPSPGGGVLAASMSITNNSPSAGWVACADTSAGTNISYRSWSFSSLPTNPFDYQWIYLAISGGSGQMSAFQKSGTTTGLSVINTQQSILYVFFTSVTTSVTIGLTVTDTLGNTSTTSQFFASLG